MGRGIKGEGVGNLGMWIADCGLPPLLHFLSSVHGGEGFYPPRNPRPIRWGEGLRERGSGIWECGLRIADCLLSFTSSPPSTEERASILLETLAPSDGERD